MSEVILVKPKLSCAVSTAACGGFDLSLCRQDRGLRRLNPSVSRLDQSLSGKICLDRIVEILLGNGFLLRERDVAVHVELSLALISVGLGDLSVGL